MALNTSITAITRAALGTPFDILEDEQSPYANACHQPVIPDGSRDVFKHLAPRCRKPASKAVLASGTGQDPCLTQRHSADCECCGIAIDKLKTRIAPHSAAQLEAKQAARPLRPRRQAIESDTFLPLDAVQEEVSCITDDIATESKPRPPTLATQEDNSRIHTLLKDIPSDYSTQIKKHLAGQFEWLVSYPPSSNLITDPNASDEHTGCEARERFYGCNILGRREYSFSSNGADGNHSIDRFVLLATPIEGDPESLLNMEPRIIEDDSFTAWEHSPSGPPTPLKVPEIMQAVEGALSPALTFVSDRSSSFGGRSSRTGSFSLSRIEDSLEELDRLEDELEALVEVTNPRRMLLLDGKAPKADSETTSGEPSKVTKRASMACLSSTFRVQSPDKTTPSLRRSSSMTLRDKRHDGSDGSHRRQTLGRCASPTKISSGPSTRPGSSLKPAKPVTTSKFELPSDAVGRRLKEQRETRMAQQAGARKTSTPLSKPRVTRSLAKPTFELPGEAISRRKREQHEAKLKAQEEEERKRREFKARPIKHTSTPSTVPRDTIASRARQAKIQEESAEKRAAEMNKAKRMSCSTPRSGPTTPATDKTYMRGRSVGADDSGRMTSASTSSSAKRNSLLYSGNPTERKDRERRERELMAKAAREQAAERSRIASREWAEKKRRREAALREAM
ncbi:hypothetical protein PT974_00171 [Cladobotryum mycophilum]|uniref:Uncharacterized protein n=1 Tax=Cladobotryum mycophilum TaxID=491253 RepID=A0ABR0T0B7_9HYPO